MKYKVIIELDENRETCFDCPLCGADDTCALQQDFEDSGDSWDTQLSQCPLEEVTNFTVCGWCGVIHYK